MSIHIHPRVANVLKFDIIHHMSKEHNFPRRTFEARIIASLTTLAVSVEGIKIKDMGSNADITQEVEVVSTLVDKNIRIFRTLAPNGIAIYKNRDFTPDWGVLKAFCHKGEITIFMGANFFPDSPIEGPESQIYKTQKEYLEWILYHELGHLFSEKFYNNLVPESFASLTGQKRPIFVWDIHENSIEETFADYFATYFTNPALLSEAERQYFAEIERTIYYNLTPSQLPP